MPKREIKKRKQQPATELTTEELAKRLFPKKVRDEIHRVAQESDRKKK